MRTMRLTGRLAAVFGACVAAGAALAADHSEAPGTRSDPSADIADVYAWHSNAENRLVTIVTFDGLMPPLRGPSGGTYDPGVLYTVHIDNDGDFVSDVQVNAWFVLDGPGVPRIRVENLPGTEEPVLGKVERVLERGECCKVFAGLRDDPFFFDLEGFQETLATGTLSFDSTRDSVAGLNAMAIALEMDLAAALAGGTILNVWATTARTGV